MNFADFVTVDVFAEHPFEGNQLAVFPDAEHIPETLLLKIAQELKLPETTFVLSPENGGDARVRIFTPDGEAAFAGHPLVGTATVIAARTGQSQLTLEVPAGLCTIELSNHNTRACVATPSPLVLAGEVPPEFICAALGIKNVLDAHPPTRAGMGREFVIAQVSADDLAKAVPHHNAFAATREVLGLDRFAILAYARTPEGLEARMFSPLTGNIEDPATGSANAALAGLLLHHSPDVSELTFTVIQGVHMGRPSTLHLHAWRENSHIFASVAGDVLPMTSGRLRLP